MKKVGNKLISVIATLMMLGAFSIGGVSAIFGFYKTINNFDIPSTLVMPLFVLIIAGMIFGIYISAISCVKELRQ